MARNNKVEVADIVKQFENDFIIKYKPSALQKKVLYNILKCRTAQMGGHEEKCDCCAKKRYSYNSCGDRHCPKCQAAKQAQWIDKLLENTLPVNHFHMVFTVPHSLNKICLFNNKIFYDILFDAVSRTLRSFGYTYYGVETGAICVLHTWGQNLSLHPHIHCIIPAAGYSISGKWKNIGHNGKYLYPVNQISKTFKGKFLDRIKRKLTKMNVINDFESIIQNVKNKEWVVFSEPSLAKAEHVIKYLGQYTHRVAITNQRIIDIRNNKVAFLAKDYSDNAKKKIVPLDGVEFLRRFAQHILPFRFVKIRKYGIYNHTTKRNLNIFYTTEDKNKKLGKKKKKESAQEIIKRITGIDVFKCPFCKKGKMLVVRELPKIRSPNNCNIKPIETFLLQ